MYDVGNRLDWSAFGAQIAVVFYRPFDNIAKRGQSPQLFSDLFAPWLEISKAEMEVQPLENENMRRKRHSHLDFSSPTQGNFSADICRMLFLIMRTYQCVEFT